MIQVDVVLVDGTDQQQFLDSFTDNDSVELVNLLVALPNLLVLDVEESYLDTLRSDSRVVSAYEQEEPDEASLPPYETQTGRVVTEIALNTFSSIAGHELMPVQLYVDSDTMPPNAQTVGNDPNDDTPTMDNVSYTSCFFGKNVDIVTLEASGPSPSYDGYHTDPHPDFRDDDGNSRFTPVDWPGSLTGQPNFTASRGSSFFNAHSLGVLSAAAGVTGGFAKKANVYVNFGSLSLTGSIDSIVQWHNAKPNNPETGVPNPTIMISEYQFSSQKRRFVPVDSIESITHDGVTTNRPGASWGSDLTVFVEKNLIPFKMENPDVDDEYFWTIPWGQAADNTAIKDANEAAWDAGIVCIHAAGNGGEVYVKRDDPEYDGTSFTMEAGSSYYRANFNGTTISSYTTYANSTAVVKHPFRSYGPHGCRRDKSIDVAAGQNSETYPILDAYTTRGKGIDIVGLGADSYTSYPTTVMGSGHRYGYFSGTSCATPTVVGKAACEMEKYYHNTGRWPTPNQTKELLLNSAVDKVYGVPSTTWDNVPDASTSSIMVAETEDDVQLLRTQIGISYNGHHRMTDLAGTTAKRAFFSGKGFERSQSQGRRPETGGVYPRPKIRR